MTEIGPIETDYAGYRFRSRLEARWAVFFDKIGIPWEYEAEGYETPLGRYLPDFRLKLHDRHVLFEVKPDRGVNPKDPRSVELDRRWVHVAGISEFYATYGLPRISRAREMDDGLFGWDGFPRSDKLLGFVKVEPDGEWWSHNFFCECPRCWAIDIRLGGCMLDEDPARRSSTNEYERWKFACCGGEFTPGCRPYLGGVAKIGRAYDDARAARFEFGESGR